MITIKNKFIIIETKNTSLVLEILKYDNNHVTFDRNREIVIQNYYGLTVDLRKINPTECIVNRGGSSDEYNMHNLIFTANGSGNNSETSILLRNSDGTNVNRFFYKSHQIIKGGVLTSGPHSRDVDETLEIVEEDDVLGIEIHHYYSTFKDSDVIAIKNKIVNKGIGKLEINKLMSLECPIPSRNLKVYSFDGKWLYERTRHETVLTSGTYMVDSKVGSSSHKHNPFIEVYDETNKQYYGFNFIYSGSHKEVVEVNSIFHSSVFVGINDFGFYYPLDKGEEFITPEAIMCTAKDLDSITLNMHDFVLNHIADPNFKNKTRPIIFNNWEGTGMNINEENLTSMAEIASSVGIEQFVMDDGWFGVRNDGTSGLGDWFIDKHKFPRGLKDFANNIRSLGLKFGIWVEPEMININTELFKNHPEFACIIPNRDPIERRTQLMIDMANKDVQDYLFDCLSKVFDETKAEYVKWDFNRFLVDNYSHADIKGDYAYNFMMGTYSLIERLKNRYPNILFESCSSGGGRYDLGMIFYMPQTWGSDDTNCYCRSFISCGTLTAYPQSTYGAHVSIDGCPLPDREIHSSIEDRFNLSATGAFGYEFDFRKRTAFELEVIKKQIVYYKKHKELFQFGKFYICNNCFDDDRYYSFTLVKDDEAMMYISELLPNVAPITWKAKGLDESATYALEVREQYNALDSPLPKEMSGKDLMEIGINIGSIYASNTDKDEFNGIYSRLIYLKKVY